MQKREAAIGECLCCPSVASVAVFQMLILICCVGRWVGPPAPIHDPALMITVGGRGRFHLTPPLRTGVERQCSNQCTFIRLPDTTSSVEWSRAPVDRHQSCVWTLTILHEITPCSLLDVTDIPTPTRRARAVTPGWRPGSGQGGRRSWQNRAQFN